jgi:hemoglobin/transferrin/lactoferrin receptor protein
MHGVCGCVTVSCLAGFLAVSAARSQGSTNPPPVSSSIPPVVVTASRMARAVQDEPGAVHVVDRSRDPVAAAARTTPDALRGLPSVMAQKTAYGQGSPYLRGFTGFRTLALIDGVRLNNSVFRDGPNQYWNTIDPFAVARDEVAMGPGSVLYGSDAVGGTLNAIPFAPPAWEAGGVWHPELFLRGATAERSCVGRAQVAGRPDPRVGFTGGYTWKRFGDLIGGRTVGEQDHTGYDERDFDGRLDLYFDADTTLTLAHQTVVQEDAWRTHRTIYGIRWAGLTNGTDLVHTFDQRRDLDYARLHAANLDGLVNDLVLTVSRQVQEEDQYVVKSNRTRERQGFDVETWGATLQLTSETDAGTWVCGIEHYHDAVDSYLRKYNADGSLKTIEIQGPVADDAAYDQTGVFVQDTLRLLDGRLDLIPGARYTYARVDAGRVKDPLTGLPMSVKDEWNALTGSLRLLCPLVPDRTWVAYAGLSQAFRAPNLSDLTRLDTARSGELETPSPGLDPERYLCAEAGIKAEDGPVSGHAALFWTWIDDMIVRAPTGAIVTNGAQKSLEVTKRNSGGGYVAGVETLVRCAFGPHWSAWASGTWMNGRVSAYPTSTTTTDRDYVSRLMPPTLETGLRLQNAGGTLWCEAVLDAAAKAGRLSAEDRRDNQRIPPGGTPGYCVYHLRTGARITEQLDVSVALENLFNEDYRIHGSGVNEPGRNLVLAARARF